MMRVDWKKIRNRIPNKVSLSANVEYEILWAVCSDTCSGETRFETKQIIIDAAQSNKEIVVTFLHELVHAFSGEYELNLTESQVIKMEKAFYYLLKDGNIFQ